VSANNKIANDNHARLFILVAVLLFIAVQNAASQSAVKKTGTFSSMEYNEEGGDLLGEEIRIVHTISGPQGVIQFSGGEPSELVLVNIDFRGDSLYFQIPSGEYKGLFQGKISKNTLVGSLKMPGKREIGISLKRKRSYWD
jgi:hypothetical protein